jgi:two-component system, NtrC family, sensor kinase
VIDRSEAAGERRRLVAIFVLTLAVVLTVAAVALREVGGTSRGVEEVLSEHAQNVLEVERLNTLSERLGRLARSYLFHRDPNLLTDLAQTRQTFERTAERLSGRLSSPEERQILTLVRRVEEQYEQGLQRALAGNASKLPLEEGVAALEREVRPAREQLDLALAALSESERSDFELARAEASARGRESFRLMVGATAAALVLAAALAWALARTLSGLARSRADLGSSLDRLERANLDLDAFAGRIAHDLRNILSPLPLLAARLRGGGDAKSVDANAEKIERVGRRAEGLIEALLAFARAGQPLEGGAAAPVREAVSEAVDDLAHLSTMVGAEVQIDVEDVAVRIAPSLLHTVLVNLLTNAFKFVEGRSPREVRVCAQRKGPICELSVSDTGPGIPFDAQTRIFEPFYRAPPATTPGVGIGLATVQRIVEAHGGRITVRSRLDEGTTFIIRLPVAEGVARTPEPAAVETPVVH